MNMTDKELMTTYGITCEKNYVYRYKEHKYSKLNDAVNYARSDGNDTQVSHSSEPNKISTNKDCMEKE